MAQIDDLINRCKKNIEPPIHLIHKDFGPCVMKSCGQGAIYVVLDNDGRTIGCRFPYALTVGELKINKAKDNEVHGPTRREKREREDREIEAREKQRQRIAELELSDDEAKKRRIEEARRKRRLKQNNDNYDIDGELFGTYESSETKSINDFTNEVEHSEQVRIAKIAFGIKEQECLKEEQKQIEYEKELESKRQKEEIKRKREERRNKTIGESNDDNGNAISELPTIDEFALEIERQEQERIARLKNGFVASDIDEETKNSVRERSKDVKLRSLFDHFDSIIFLDTETTGLDSKNDRLIEIAAIKVVLNNNYIELANEMDYFIQLPDGMTLNEQIAELTGITNEDLILKGQSSTYVAQQFVSMFAGERTLLVAYNAQFDCSFIYWMLVREGLSDCLKNIKMLDALTIYKDRKPYPHKLANAIETYDLTELVANTHRAIDDTLSLFEVVKAMCREYDDLDKYINLFGYNPKYGVNGAKIQSVRYLPQPYNNWKKLYEE